MYKIFLTGGAIRDKLLNLPIKDKDWLITQSNYKTISKMGFKIVGKDFPVFLHSITKEEYALARKEKKISKGYNGFKCYFSSKIKINNDLFRRDITINATVLNNKGFIIDYFNCINDFKNKKIKHISKNFLEDPIRILRVKRMLIKYNNKGFLLSPLTHKLIKNINYKEIKNITKERITKELIYVINYKYYYIFFNFLNSIKKLKYKFKNLYFNLIVSNKFKFNLQLNNWTKLIKNIFLLNKYLNNEIIKISVILIYTKEKNLILISKKHIKIIKNITNIKLIYKNLKNKNIKKYLYKKNIIKNKNKLTIINCLMINDLKYKINDYIYDYKKKYFILELLENNSVSINKYKH